MILVEAELLAFSTVHDAIFPVEMRGLEGTDKERGVNRRLRGGQGGRGRMGELVILYGLDAAAAGKPASEKRSDGEGCTNFAETHD